MIFGRKLLTFNTQVYKSYFFYSYTVFSSMHDEENRRNTLICESFSRRRPKYVPTIVMKSDQKGDEPG